MPDEEWAEMVARDSFEARARRAEQALHAARETLKTVDAALRGFRDSLGGSTLERVVVAREANREALQVINKALEGRDA